MDNNKNNIPFAPRSQIVILVALACLNIALVGVVGYFFPQIHPAIMALVLVAVFLIEVSLTGVFRQRNQEYLPESGIHALLTENSSQVLKNSKQPVAIFNNLGILSWCNYAMKDILSTEETLVGRSIDHLFGEDFVLDNLNPQTIRVNDRIYSAESFVLPTEDENDIYVLMLNDVTERTELKDK